VFHIKNVEQTVNKFRRKSWLFNHDKSIHEYTQKLYANWKDEKNTLTMFEKRETKSATAAAAAAKIEGEYL
jgi:hypothetical protein